MTSTGCAVRDRGLELRPDCRECRGAPSSGQLWLERGAALHLEGDPARSLHMVVNGYLSETRTWSDGRSIGIRLLGPGDLAGTDVLRAETHGDAVHAITPAKVCEVSQNEVRRRLRESAAHADALVEALSDDLARMREQLVLVQAMSAEERVLEGLRHLTRWTPEGCWTRLPLTREELGNVLGLTRATTSRVLHRLARRGAVEVDGARVRWPNGQVAGNANSPR